MHESAYDHGRAGRTERISEQLVRIEIVESAAKVAFLSDRSILVTSDGSDYSLPAGRYVARAENVTPAGHRFHLFAKTFQLNETAERDAYVNRSRREGFTPEIVRVGHRYETASGSVLDTRVDWVSIAQYPASAQAEKAKAELAEKEQWTWLQEEVTSPGSAEMTLTAADGKVYGTFTAPFSVRNASHVTVSGVGAGYWDDRRAERSYRGTLDFAVNPAGELSVYEQVGMETYLEGVLPAEMPSSWPLEALKAQAVAARSEVLSSLGTKHRLEGFDFCGVDHCRAYLGSHHTRERAAAAVESTRGEILTIGDKIAPTVFSSNCGGWTENNDAVWFGPPAGALRGISDVSGATGKSPGSWSSWLIHPPDAYCRADTKYFRWKRVYSRSELAAIVNKKCDVGDIHAIELGERGVSGRLKWVRIRGSKGTQTIRKELPIRAVFGGLPSALFIVEEQAGGGGVESFTFLGGGRGHGVGLCQYGARGMALQGVKHVAILKHYFSGVEVERYQ